MLESVAFFFSSTSYPCCNYATNAFDKMLEGNEFKGILNKVIISYGDIIDEFRVFDIEPYIIRDNICSIKEDAVFDNFPFCILIEGIDSENRERIDNRLKIYDSYFGCTRISYYSTDIRRNFHKLLIRNIALESGILYYGDSKENKSSILSCFEKKLFHIVYDQYDYDFTSMLISKEISMKIKEVRKKIPVNVEIIRNKVEMGYKLNMEVRLATALILESIEKIAKVNFIDVDEPYLPENAYFTIYNAAQGIERLQKVLIELLIRKNNYKIDEEIKLYELLYSHNHSVLKNYIDVNVSYPLKDTNVNKLVDVLSKFYNSIRYNNYSKIGGHSRTEFYSLLRSFGNFNEKDIKFDLSVKNTFGKTIGKYTRFLYENIREVSLQLSIFPYELEGDSYGMHVLYCQEENLYKEYVNILHSKKEFIFKLIKDGPKCIKSIKIDALNIPDDIICDYLPDFIMNDFIKIHDEIGEQYDTLLSHNRDAFKERFETIEYLFDIIANYEEIE